MSAGPSPEVASRTVVYGADYVVTMDPELGTLEGASVAFVGNQITEVSTEIVPSPNDKVIDASGQLVIPGLINTHHHTSQALLRGLPALQNQPIERWIDLVSRATQEMDEDMLFDATQLNLAELALYGCTTTADMLYTSSMHRNSYSTGLPVSFEAASMSLMRYHPFLGGIGRTQKDGTLFPDDLAEDPDEIAQYLELVIGRVHDPSPSSRLRIGVGLCGIFANLEEDFKNAVVLSEANSGVRLQTHVSESAWENHDTWERLGKRPVDALQDLGWAGDRTSYVHCINITDKDEIINRIARDGTHVSHCPVSNARSSVGEQGIAPVTEMLRAGANVGLGVDGSAGNDSSNLVEEMRWARTIQGARRETTYLDPARVLYMATIGGAKLLGRETELGSITPSKAADIAIFPLNTIEAAGGTDPVTTFIATQAVRAATVIGDGEVIVRNSRLASLDEEGLVARVQAHKRKLMERLS